jgi:DNA-binding CsgD family transcriptional regulator
MNLEPYVEVLRHMFARRDFYEVMANTFQSPEYWQKYRRAVNQTDSASQVYAIVFSDLLRTFNEDLAAESAVARKGNKLVTTGTALVVLSGILLVVLASGFWYVSRIRKSALIQLRNAQASEEYREELKLKYELIVSEMASLLGAKGNSIPKSEIQKVVSQHVNQTTLDRDQMRQWMVEFDLTRTEAEVLARIVLGQTNAELVSDLDLSKSYIHNVRSKLRHKLPLLEGEDLELFAQRLKTHDD